MSVQSIVVWPDPRLREKTVAISDFGDATKALYDDLVDTMHAYQGIGIAAIQIGVSKQMFLLEANLCGGEQDDAPWAFINPTILHLSDDTERSDEGCLSFPGIYIPIERSFSATVKAQNLQGEWFELEGEALLARAIQHEYDHLTGKVMTDFVGPLKRRMVKRRLERENA